MSPEPERFLAALRGEGTASPATIAALENDLGILDRHAGGRPWRDLAPADVRGFLAAEHMRGLAPTSLRRILSSWRRFFRHLADRGALVRNPADGVRAPKGGSGLPNALSPDEISRLLAAATGGGDDLAVRDAAMFEVAYSSALRVSELVGLDLADVDERSRMVNVREGKGAKQRLVPIGEPALAALARWRGIRAGWGVRGEALFVNGRGGRLTARSAQLRLKALAAKAGLPGNLTPHALRHSCASHLLQSSGDLRAVQEFLGHADVSSTQIYTHLDFQALAKVYDRAHPRAKKGAAG